MADVDRLFGKLADATTRLNRARDSVSEVITRLNTRLQALNLGEFVVVKEPLRLGDFENGEPLHLAFGKDVGNWVLMLAKEVDAPDAQGWSIRSLMSYPLWVRVRALEKIPDLLQMMILTAQEETTSIETSIQQHLRDLLSGGTTKEKLEAAPREDEIPF